VSRILNVPSSTLSAFNSRSDTLPDKPMMATASKILRLPFLSFVPSAGDEGKQ